MRRVFFYVIFIVATVLCFSCEETGEGALLENQEIISISYGTSFGECQGYCNRHVTITEDEIKFLASGWYGQDNLPEINLTVDYNSNDWQSLVDKINFIVFRNLEEVIGCPDCADGGAEWIEISTNNVVHKVTFEYNNEPEEIEEYIDILSELLEGFGFDADL